MTDFDKYQRTTEAVKDEILDENRRLARKLAEKDQSFELVKFVHFDKSIDLETLNDIIIGCTGCLHAFMFMNQRVITNMSTDDPLYRLVLMNRDKLLNNPELMVSSTIIPDYTVVMYPVSSSQMLSDSRSFVKNIILLYPTKFINQEVLDFVKSFMIVNEVLINIVLTRDKMVELIETDPLTRVLNRSSWNSTLRQIVSDPDPHFILFMDVDHFKIVNDTLGHLRGDDILRFTGTWLRSIFRGEDRIFRLGGDEFAVTGRVNSDSKAGLIAKLRSLNTAFSDMVHQLLGVHATISIGTLIVEHPMTAEEIYTHADNLLYQAKEEGRNRIVIVSDSRTLPEIPRGND